VLAAILRIAKNAILRMTNNWGSRRRGVGSERIDDEDRIARDFRYTLQGSVVKPYAPMAMRIVLDEDKPSAAIEIPLEKPLPDYDLEQLEQPTPRDVDGILVSQGFRDLIDDARGVLMDLLAHPPSAPDAPEEESLHFTHPVPLQLTQLTGAICPGDDEVYRPGLWIVIEDPHAKPKTKLSPATQERVAAIADELVKRMLLA
jgi:hypothetical protein